MDLLLGGCSGLGFQATRVGYSGASVDVCVSRWVCARVGACLRASGVSVLAQVSALPWASVCVWMSVRLWVCVRLIVGNCRSMREPGCVGVCRLSVSLWVTGVCV